MLNISFSTFLQRLEEGGYDKSRTNSRHALYRQLSKALSDFLDQNQSEFGDPEQALSPTERKVNFFYRAFEISGQRLPDDADGYFHTVVSHLAKNSARWQTVAAAYYALHQLPQAELWAIKVDIAVLGSPFHMKFELSPEQEDPDRSTPEVQQFLDRFLKSRVPLRTPPDRDNAFVSFANRTLPILGRSNEEQWLSEFVEMDKPFGWFQLAGVGGQGKSKLALSLIEKITPLGWDAGFVPDHYDIEFDFDLSGFAWRTWSPMRPTLMVFDYVIGREEKVGTLLRQLASRAQFPHKVRVLLVERQPWDLAWVPLDEVSDDRFKAPLERGSDWFETLHAGDNACRATLIETHFGLGPLVLGGLPETSLIAITREQAKREGSDLSIDDVEIAKHLSRIDKDARPLYAYFLGTVLADREDVSDWSREDLLNAVLKREHRKFLKPEYGDQTPLQGSNHPAIRLALVATILGSLDLSSHVTLRGWLDKDPQAANLANAICGLRVPDAEVKTALEVQGLQPDILGEYFVLTYMSGLIDVHEVLSLAWNLNASTVGAFLTRVAQDFPHHEMTKDLIDASSKASATSANNPFLAHVADLVNELWRASAPISERLKTSLSKAADNGNGDAMLCLGSHLDWGHIFEQDKEKAAELWMRAAEVGDPVAMSYLGRLYALGWNDRFPMDNKRAFFWYFRSAKAGDVRGMIDTGLCFQDGIGVSQNPKGGVYWYEQAAQNSSAVALVNLGGCYENERGVAKDEDAARRCYEIAGRLGDARGMFLTGWCYETGFGTEPALETAFGWYKAGADAGETAAMVKLGHFYKEGTVGSEDSQQAIRWYKNAAFRDNAHGMFNFAWCHHHGYGTIEKPKEAFRWYEQSANGLDPAGMNALGWCYRARIGTGEKRDRAFFWFKASAEAGYVPGMVNTAWCYLKAYGTSQKLELYHDWTRRAAIRGDLNSIYQTGLCYERAIGTDESLQNAYDWFLRGAERDHQASIEAVVRFCNNGLISKTDAKRAERWLDQA